MVRKQITEITYDWFYTDECGESYKTATVGKGGVVRIDEILDDLMHRYRIEYDDGQELLVFNPNTARRG